MNYPKSIDKIVTLIDNLSPEEKMMLFAQLDKYRQNQQHPLLNIPSTLTNNPLLDEVSEHIAAYRQEIDRETEQEVEVK